eukprot:TRINITY_DN6508_c0_g1_i5.p1 TRINITY_DN6508_c0_g1~~TRINITY_DN6508_c0_g1_i5.p1  ORF type:complete len:1718 (+),score=341.66 TRINITY_DN6508_c0_g1_i5:58-5211(+)
MLHQSRISQGPVRPETMRLSHVLQATDFDDSSFAKNPLKLKLFATFAPTQVLMRVMDKTLPPLEAPEYEEFEATLLFADISGFSALADQLTKAKGVEGMEVLNKVINNYFTVIARCINSFGGDVIKFSGDAMMAVWPVKPGQNDSLEKATLKATQCGFLILQQRPTLPPTGKDTPIELQVHIGLGAGTVVGMHVGGVNDRCEYVIGGEPLQQITGSEHLAKAGEIVVSPQAWKLIHKEATGVPVYDEDARPKSSEDGVEAIFFTPDFKTIEMGSFPTIQIPLGKKGLDDDGQFIPEDAYIKITNISIPSGEEKNLRNEQLAKFAEIYDHKMGEIILKYTPEPLRMQFALGEMQRVGELRRVTIMFMRLADLQYTDCETAVPKLHEAMLIFQQALFDYGGVLSRLQIDDKGTVFKAAFGLPPRSHEDDPVRGLLAALQMVSKLREIGLNPCIGLATSTVFFGVVGSLLFREFSTVGSTVNLAARMMQAASSDVPILCEDSTYQLSKDKVKFVDKQAIKCKGYKELIKIYQPLGPNNSYVKQLVDYPLRGRSHEKRQLEQIVRAFVLDYRKAEKVASPGITLVVGDHGFGKSSLVSETVRTASGMSMVTLSGQGEELFQSAFLHPWKKIFATLFNLGEAEFEKYTLTELQSRVYGTLSAFFEAESQPILLTRNSVTPQSLNDDEDSVSEQDTKEDLNIMQSHRSLICANPFVSSNSKRMSKITGHEIEISVASKKLTILESCNIDSEEIAALIVEGKSTDESKIAYIPTDDEAGDDDEVGESNGDHNSHSENSDVMRSVGNLHFLDQQRTRRSISKSLLPPPGEAPLWVSFLPLLNELFPFKFPESPTTQQLTGPHRTVALYQFLQSILTAISHRYPLLITLEDIEWLDSPSWTLLQLLVYSSAPILFICSLTKSPKDADPSHLSFIPVKNRITLAPLGEAGIRNHLCDVLQVKGFQKSLFEFIFNRSSGNPLVARQILLTLKSRGEITIVCGECEFNPACSSTILSDTGNFQALVAKRLDALSPSQQFTLQVASVIGSRFTKRQINEIFPHSHQHDRIAADINELIENGILMDVTNKYPIPEGDLCYTFEYLLIHDVCYNMLAFQMRKQLHDAVAKWSVEMKNREYSRTNLVAYSLSEENIAQHWDKAENYLQASFYWERAGISFIMKSCYSEAVQSFDKACKALSLTSDADLKRSGELLVNLGEACVLRGDYKKAKDAFENALKLYGREIPEAHPTLKRKINKAKSRLFLHNTMLFSKNFLAHHKVPLDIVTSRSPYVWMPELYSCSQQRYRALLCNLRLIDLLPEDKNPQNASALAVSLSESALLRQAGKEISPSRQCLEKALHICMTILENQTFVVTQVLHNISVYYCGLCKWELAEDAIDEAHQLALDNKDPLAADKCELVIARMAYMRGWFPYALHVFQSTISSASSRSDPLREANAHVGAAQCLLRLGRFSEAEKHLEATKSKLSYLGEDTDFALEAMYRAMMLRLIFYSHEYSKAKDLAAGLSEYLFRRNPDDISTFVVGEAISALLEFHLISAFNLITHRTAQPTPGTVHGAPGSTSQALDAFGSAPGITTIHESHSGQSGLLTSAPLSPAEVESAVSMHISSCRKVTRLLSHFSDVYPIYRPVFYLWYGIYNYAKDRKDLASRLLKQSTQRSFETKNTWCLGMSFLFTSKLGAGLKADERARRHRAAVGIFSKIGEAYYASFDHGESNF